MSSAGLTFIATSFATALLTALHFHAPVPNYPKLEVEVEGCVHEMQAGVRMQQWWANLDQASKHLEVFRFRDLSPTPIP
jgi:hypothetical protein